MRKASPERIISIHAPLRERLSGKKTPAFIYNISIHAPLRERQMSLLLACFIIRFQSTLPCGSDNICYTIYNGWRYFNPRSLAGATCGILRKGNTLLVFQSTLPCGSDMNKKEISVIATISIHAPLRERQHQKKILLFSFKSSIYCELAQLKYSKILF